MNKSILIGRLTDNPELKTTPNGKYVAEFTLAVNRDFKNAEGNYEADFINCVAFNQAAETISKYVHKGDKFGVEGRIQVRSYTNKEGNKRYITEVVVESFEFLEPKKSVDVAPEEPNYDGFEEIDISNLPFNV